MTQTVTEVDPREVGLDPTRLARVDRHFARYVDEGRLPGWSLVIGRYGRTAHASTYGKRDVEAGTPVTDDTLYRIYSMTKPITAVAALMLYEEGAFELTDPVGKYLPAFENQRVLVGGTAARPVTVPAIEPVRIWHLLTHTAGLTYGFHHVDVLDEIYRAAGFEWGTPRGLDLAGCVDAWAGLPLAFQPGTEWNYSVSIDVVGRLVEVLSGQTLDAFFAERIFGPLKMTDTAFTVAAADADRLAALYAPTSRDGAKMVRNERMGRAILREPRYLAGGGGLVSTRNDYHRFAQMLLQRGELDGVRLLGDRTVRYMAANHLPGGVDLAAFGRPLFAETTYEGTGFGLGVSVVLDPVAGRTLGSAGEFGWGGAASTAFWVDPAEQLTVVFLTQLLPSNTYPLRSQLHQLVYSALIDRTP
ncbi:serine hydrolase domain-containing protein [Cryptosporangium aurantiacum]|uniref:CubicO group peptidase, beta-lactamase class C family n=1 Tax=Cryptosporangium aurantiacum TaxID=134849 RepID=A0A1M7RLY7_9ACTN|nr:serine hydrolase domain-containing protein [Cryptosporangium aurantiacum]SHN47274.1 CubicO group peptidase, beta-lactamase class C family [Cryptosporangium aurantiacum]